MQSSMERNRLVRAMNTEPVRARMVLVKCAAGLAVVVLLAVIGVTRTVDPGGAGNVATAVKPHTAPAAQEHRKQVFDERRARFAGGAGRQGIAGHAVAPANQLPVSLR